MASATSLEAWVASSTDAISITLFSPSKSGLKPIDTFHPRFTYSIFGEDEKLFGYKNPRISLRFRANDMRPHFKLGYAQKYKALDGNEPTDIRGILGADGHLPKIAFSSEADFETNSKEMPDDWSPPGVLHSTVEMSDGTYEVWRGNLADPAVQQLNSRVQILVSLFVEGAQYIGRTFNEESEAFEFDYSDADRWTIFFLYKRQPNPDDAQKNSYTFVGYSTVYRFYHFQPSPQPLSPGDEWELPTGDLDLAQLPSKARLSQFIILPTFQGHGKGALLYDTIFAHYHKNPQTVELTVEDPNEAFDDLRDACDLGFLRTMPEFRALHVNTKVTVPKTGTIPQLVAGGDLESIRKKAKIAPRQFYRVLEIFLMSQLPLSVRPSMAIDDDKPEPTKAEKHQERLWRLIVKQRLYRHNKELLSQIEKYDRIGKIEETLGGVELEYARLLAAHDRVQSHAKDRRGSASNGKRRLEDDPAEDPSSSKRARIDVVEEA